MRSVESNSKGTGRERSNLKRSRSSRSPDMSLTDSTMAQNPGDESCFFPVEEIVQYPLPGYVAPTSISYSPDDKLVAYLFSPDHSLSRKVFVFDVESGKHRMVFSPPDGGLDEGNISEAEKLRRERARERGLGVTRYEWVKGSPRKRVIMVPLPDGVCFVVLHLILLNYVVSLCIAEFADLCLVDVLFRTNVCFNDRLRCGELARLMNHVVPLDDFLLHCVMLCSFALQSPGEFTYKWCCDSPLITEDVFHPDRLNLIIEIKLN